MVGGARDKLKTSSQTPQGALGQSCQLSLIISPETFLTLSTRHHPSFALACLPGLLAHGSQADLPLASTVVGQNRAGAFLPASDHPVTCSPVTTSRTIFSATLYLQDQPTGFCVVAPYCHQP